MAAGGQPFSLSFRKNSRFVYVRFRDEVTGQYGNYISTHKETKREAAKVAWRWLSEGIPQVGGKRRGASGADDIFASIRRADASGWTDADKRKICAALCAAGVIKSAVVSGSPGAVRLADYLVSFWDWDASEYVREKTRARQRMTKGYVQRGAYYVRRYWIPHFGDKLLGEVTRADLRGFLEGLAGFGLSGSTCNQIFQTGAIALRFAYSHEQIPEDVAAVKGFTMYAPERKPRNILTDELLRAVLCADWRDERSKLAFFVATFTGMRAGEIQALRLQDLGAGRIYVNHSFSYTDGLKTPKNGEAREALFPFPEAMDAMKGLAEENPHGDFFVFWGAKPGVPMDKAKWLSDFRAALVSAGLMSADEAKKYCFHGQRHYFTTNMKAHGMDGRILQQQTGHKSLAMLAHYADHVTAQDERTITDGQRRLYGDIFPAGGGAVVSGAEKVTGRTRQVSAAEILAGLPAPESGEPLEALERAGLVRGGEVATDKGLMLCAAYLLRHGYSVTPETLAGIRKRGGGEYGTAVAGATLRKAAAKHRADGAEAPEA